MTDQWTSTGSKPSAARRRLRTAALVAGGVVAGGVLAGTISATAASNGSTPAPPSSGYSASAPQGQKAGGARGFGHGGSAPVRGDETSLSADVTARLTAAAVAKVPGATVYRVETDSADAAYEAHMTKSDGTLVTVKFDKNYAVTAVENGMGTGDPAPAGGQGMQHGPGPQGGTGTGSGRQGGPGNASGGAPTA
jgi:hypothetical protein